MALRILIFSDLPLPSGFGRISTYCARYLHYRGHDVRGAGLWYGGDPHGHPFHIYPLAGKDTWQELTRIINGVDNWIPDLVISCQDFPYHLSLGRDCPIDWSKHRWIFITPIDGMPVYKEWEAASKMADGKMIISKFGVESMRQQGVKTDLCQPGIDTSEFYPATPEEKAQLRAIAGIPNDAWILGMFCMNQGRKAIPNTIQGFRDFAVDKPNVCLYLDMDEISPAGWNIQYLAEQIGLPLHKVLLRKQLQPRLPNLRDRYAILDAHSVLSYREGFGLPLMESQACHIPTIAQDWCSGTEIVGEGKGYLVPVLIDKYGERVMNYSTWGNSQDAIPDLKEFVNILNDIYYNPIKANSIADKGYQWASKLSWEDTGESVERVITRIYGGTALRRGTYIEPNVGNDSFNPTVPINLNVNQQSVSGSDNIDRRQQSELEPSGLVLSTDKDQQEPNDTGFRGELQSGGVVSVGSLYSLSELGHGSTTYVVREINDRLRKASKIDIGVPPIVSVRRKRRTKDTVDRGHI